MAIQRSPNLDDKKNYTEIYNFQKSKILNFGYEKVLRRTCITQRFVYHVYLHRKKYAILSSQKGQKKLYSS